MVAAALPAPSTIVRPVGCFGRKGGTHRSGIARATATSNIWHSSALGSIIIAISCTARQISTQRRKGRGDTQQRICNVSHSSLGYVVAPSSFPLRTLRPPRLCVGYWVANLLSHCVVRQQLQRLDHRGMIPLSS